MPVSADPTAPRRAARYEERMRKRGFVKKHVWVPAGRVAEFEKTVAALRDEHSGVTTPDLKKVLARLRRHEQSLRREGVEHLSLFGSVARDEATAKSDVDVMVTFLPEARIGLFELTGLRQHLEDIAGFSVDLVQEKSLRERVRPQAMRDKVEVF